MRLVEFPEQTTIVARDQPEYRVMPAHIDQEGLVTCCWSLSWKERFQVLIRGKIWHQILTFKYPLQPQLLLVDKPELNKV